ncbi:MAG: hypothetical protein AAF320_06805, partial [Myxococcota bacterium]
MRLKLLSFILLISIGCAGDPNGNQTKTFNSPYSYYPSPGTTLPGESVTPRLQGPSTGDTAGAVCSQKYITKEMCNDAVAEIQKHGDKHNCIKKASTFCARELFNATKDIKDKQTRETIYKTVGYIKLSSKESLRYIQQERTVKLAIFLLEKLGGRLNDSDAVTLFVEPKGDQEKQDAIREYLADKHALKCRDKELLKLVKEGIDIKTAKNIIKIISASHKDPASMLSEFIIKVPYGSEPQQLAFTELIKYGYLGVKKLADIRPLYDKAFQLIESKPYAQYSNDEKKFLTGFLAVFYKSNCMSCHISYWVVQSGHRSWCLAGTVGVRS